VRYRDLEYPALKRIRICRNDLENAKHEVKYGWLQLHTTVENIKILLFPAFPKRQRESLRYVLFLALHLIWQKHLFL